MTDFDGPFYKEAAHLGTQYPDAESYWNPVTARYEFRYLGQNFSWGSDPLGLNGGIRLTDEPTLAWKILRDGTLLAETDLIMRVSCLYQPPAALPFFLAAVARSADGSRFLGLIEERQLVTSDLSRAYVKRAEYLREPGISAGDFWNPVPGQFEFYYRNNSHIWKPMADGGGIRIIDPSANATLWRFLEDGTCCSDHGEPYGPRIYVPELLWPLFWEAVRLAAGEDCGMAGRILKKHELSDDINMMLTGGW